MYSSFVEEAARQAEFWHRNQKRKYTDEPYFNHLVEVGVTLFWAGCDEEVIAAGFLHDSMEDQAITAYEITRQFGTRVCRLVQEVTDVSKPEDGNRAFRKKLDMEHLAQASADGMTIKLADIISNTRSIVEKDPKFAKVYLPEKKALLPLLKRGNSVLWQIANEIVENS